MTRKSPPPSKRKYSEMVWLPIGRIAPTSANANRLTGLPNTYEQASQYLAHLSEDERYAVRRLSVLRWFDRPLYEFIENVQPSPLRFENVIRLDGVNPLGRAQAPDQYTIAPVLREYLASSFRKESIEEFITVHRLAASYFHRPLAEVDLTTLGYVIDELGYLSVANPDEATLRLAQFGHSALMAGWTEAASRAARAVEQSRSVVLGSAWSVPVARLVAALATIFSRANLDMGSTTELSAAIAGVQEPQSDAENLLVSLARQAQDRFSLFGIRRGNEEVAQQPIVERYETEAKFPAARYTSAGSYLGAYLEHTAVVASSIDPVSFDRAASLLLEAYSSGAWVFCCGNGGSAAIANQLQSDHVKSVRAGTDLIPRVVSLNANIELTTAIANDLGYEDIFVYQLQSLASPGDVLIAVSSSGRSPNIVRALTWGRDHGLRTIALTGFDGGAARSIAEIRLHVDAVNYGIVQDLHQAVVHALGQYIRQSRMVPDAIAAQVF